MMTKPPVKKNDMKLHLISPLTLIALLSTCMWGACTLRYDFSTECTSDQDCQVFEGKGTLYTCNAVNTCVGQTIPSLDMSMDMPSTTCSKNSECVERFGNTFACNDANMCFNLIDDEGDCMDVHYPQDGAIDDVVFVGSLMPLVEPFGSLIGRPLRNAIQLGIDGFNGEGGLPGGRKIAWISCDTQGNAQIATRAATHLAEKVKIKALIGPLFSEAFISVVSNVTNKAEHKILALAPGGTSPTISSLRDQNKLVWRNITSDVFQGYATVKRIQDTGLQKVLVLYKDDKYGEDLQNEVTPKLIADFGTEHVRVAKYTNPAQAVDPSPEGLGKEYGMTIASVMRPELGDMTTWFNPEVVYIAGTNEAVIAAGAYMNLVAGTFQQTPGRVLLSHGAVPSLGEFAESIDLKLHKLVEAISPNIFDANSSAYQTYSIAYNTTFNNTDPVLISTTTFDGTMAVLFAMSTIPAEEEITGVKIAQGMARLADKEADRIEFFTSGYIGKARLALSQGKNVDLVGISGEMDFDPNNGEVYSDFVGWTITDNVAGGYTTKASRLMEFPNSPETAGAEWVEIPVSD